MKAMILAAGLGKRMRPLTDHTPKPLLAVRGKALIEWHLERIARAGIVEVLINVSYLGEQIEQAIGDGRRWGLRVSYSREPQPLETGGAILHARQWLGEAPFVLINADIFTDFELRPLVEQDLPPDALGHLVLVPNPAFKSRGDFALNGEVLSLLSGEADGGFTFSGLSLLKPELILRYPRARECFALVEALHWAIAHQRLTGEIYRGLWSDVGTPERLAAL